MLQFTMWKEFLGYNTKRRTRKPRQTRGLTELVSQRLEFREVARYCRAKYWRREERRDRKGRERERKRSVAGTAGVRS